MRHARALLRPFVRERFDLARRNTADGRRPFGGLRFAVLVAEDVVFEPIVADRVRIDVILVEEPLGHPHVGNGRHESGVGIGKHRNPLVSMRCSSVVQIGAHVYLLDADFGQPEAILARQLTLPAPGGGFHVAPAEDKHIGVLGDIEQEIAHVELTERILTPHVLGTPIPTLPAVGLARLVRPIVAEDVHEARSAAVGGVHDFGFPVAVALNEDGGQAVFVDNAVYFSGDEIGRLVPGNTDELALAAVLGVALAPRIPIGALVRMEDPVLRVHALFIGVRIRRKKRFHRGMKLAAAGLDGPRLQILG